jgi:hypothetical protein
VREQHRAQRRGGHRLSWRNAKLRYRNALGSTRETRACLDVAEVFGYVECDAQLCDDLDRIAATLHRLIE